MKRIMRTKRSLLVSIISTTALLAFVVTVLAAAQLIVVTPASLDGWQLQTDSTATVSFVSGPATPPLGVGSAQLSVGSDGDSGAQLRNIDYAGVQLSDLTALTYSTYVSQDVTFPTTGDQTAYIILNVDRDGNGTIDDLLFFEPEYQHGYTTAVPDQGDNVLNTWQTWNALTGGWYGIDPFGNPTFAGPGSNVQPLSNYVSSNPSAVIRNSGSGKGGVRLVAGFGAGSWDNFVGNVDNFTIGVSGNNTTYDFEPQIGPPANPNACKNGGWKTFNTPRTFKNQGDCIQYVNTGK